MPERLHVPEPKGARGEALRPVVERHLPAWVWDPVLTTLLLVPAALVALLLHPQSREHQKIWFS